MKTLNESLEELKVIRVSPKERLVPTGFSSLDCDLGGGLPLGVSIVASMPGVGKTTFCLQMALNMAKEEHTQVLYISVEQIVPDLLAKLLNNLSNTIEELPSHTREEIRRNNEPIDEADYDILANYLTDIVGNRLHLLYSRDFSEIRKEIEKLRPTYQEDRLVVFVDYIQYIDLEENKSEYDSIGYHLNEIDKLTKKDSITTICISSVPKDKYNKHGLDICEGNGRIGFASIDFFSLKSISDNLIELRIDKAKYGAHDINRTFNYYAEHDYFEEN